MVKLKLIPKQNYSESIFFPDPVYRLLHRRWENEHTLEIFIVIRIGSTEEIYEMIENNELILLYFVLHTLDSIIFLPHSLYIFNNFFSLSNYTYGLRNSI